MRLLAQLRALLRLVRGRDLLEREMDQEFRSHIAHRADDLERRGLPRAAAERAARVEFGSVEGYKDAARDSRGLALHDELRSNIAFAWRGVRHRPLQALIVVVTLTLGIGINAGAFSTLDVLAFRPRVDGDPATFVRIFSAYGTDSTPPGFPAASQLGDYLAYRDHVRTLRAIAGWQGTSTTVGRLSGTTTGMLVTCEFFEVYAPVRPLAGRTLQSEDCTSRSNVVVVSELLWRDVLSSAPDAVGRVVRINGQPLRVVGIVPLFSGPVNEARFWTPYTLRGYLQLGTDDPAAATAMRLTIDGRLREGYSRSDVSAELRVLAAQQDRVHHGRHTSVIATDGSMLNRPGNTIAVLTIVAFVFVALACLALVACANVVSLLLAVAHMRHVEMALRMALGSGSARLARMLLTETLGLAVIAGVLASIVASRTPPFLIAFITQRSLTYPTQPNWHVFTFLFATTLLAAVVIGSAPIRAALRLDLVAALRGLTKDTRNGRSRSSNTLMGAQIGGAVALLVAAVALGRMPARIAAAPAHLDARRVLALNILPPDRGAGEWSGYHEDVRRAIAQIPGVEIVAFGSAAPVGDERTGSIVATAPGQRARTLPAIRVSSQYFEAFGIHLVRGRLFTTADESCVATVCPAVVSLETVRELWPHDEPLGKHLVVSPCEVLEVVGVVGDAPSDMAARAEALMVYRSWTPSVARYQAFVRFNGDAAVEAHAMSVAILDHFPGAVSAPETIQASLDRITAAFYRMGVVVGAVALIAAILALVGVYGVVSLSAKRRMKEMGIRMALGARDVDVHFAMLRSNVPPVFTGLGVGVVVAIGFTVLLDRLTATELPVRLADPLAFWAAPLALAVVVLLAIVAPAWRVTGANPVQALRQE